MSQYQKQSDALTHTISIGIVLPNTPDQSFPLIANQNICFSSSNSSHLPPDKNSFRSVGRINNLIMHYLDRLDLPNLVHDNSIQVIRTTDCAMNKS